MTMETNKRRNSGISAILFDLDNTLISTRKGDAKACNKLKDILWEKYEVPSECAAMICSNFLRSFRKCPDNSDMNLDDWRKFLWRGALGDQYNKFTDQVYRDWLNLRYKYLALTSDIHSLLINLRQHYFVGLITNGPTNAQWEKVKKLNLQTYFDIILVSGDLPWEKPHYKIFHEACEFLGVEPGQCIMVGDKLETDILGGIQAQLGGTVWIPLNDSFLEATDPVPDYTIKHVTELVNILPKTKGGANKFRAKISGFSKLSLADVDDCNSNSSDGS